MKFVPKIYCTKIYITMKVGEVILEEEPFCHVLLQSLKGSFCDRCFSSVGELKKCTGCGVMYYCDRTCQKRDWTIHKTECRCLKKVRPKTPVDSVRLMLRLIISLNLQLPMNSPYSRTYDDFESHREEIGADTKRSEQFAQVAYTLREYASDIVTLPAATELFDIFCKMMINSFTICDEVLDHIGTGVYLSGSMFDHSCTPNAVATFQGNTLIVRAIKDIPNPSPDKVFISYIEQLATTEERQTQLMEQYYFKCQCERCLDTKMDQRMQSIYCPSCKVILEFIPEHSDGCYCEKCGALSTIQLQKMNKLIQNCKKCLAELDCKKLSDPKYVLNQCERLLQALQDNIPTTNIYHVRLLDKALLAAIDTQAWEKALDYGCKTLEAYRLYYPGLSLNYALQLFKVGKLQLYLQDLEHAHRNLCQSQKMLSQIYKHDTDRNPMYKDLLLQINQCEEERRVQLEYSS